MVVLAAVATVIASQAAISGSFSVAKQAVQLGFLPRLRVLHTSKMEGQIYVPFVNWMLCVGVVALTLVFRSATKLGDIYGVAVTGTFILNTLLFVAVARLLWGTAKRKLAPLARAVPDRRGRVLQLQHRQDRARRVAVAGDRAGDVDRDDQLAPRPGDRHPQPRRAGGTAERVPRRPRLPSSRRSSARPGVAVFLYRDKDTTPLALRAEVEHTHTLHQKVVIVSVDTVSIPHVETVDRFAVEMLGHGRFKVFHVTVRIGYHDKLNVPEALALAASRDCSSATSTSSTPRTSSRGSRSRRPTHRACSAGARSSSSRWPATPPARSITSDCPATAP